MTIKFRGKRVDSGEWIYGDLVRCPTSSTWKGHNAYIRDWTGNRNHLILPESHGMFTGLYDCTGHEIYKGDILRSFDSKGVEIIHVIDYEDESARFIPQYLHNKKLQPQSSGITQNWINEFQKEIIGNVFDDIHLLQ